MLLIPDTVDDARLHAAPVDGVVAAGCSPHLPRLRAVMARRGVPVITAGNQVDDDGCVGVENVAASARLARHLHELGHRRVAMVRLPTGRVADARTAGTREVFPDAIDIVAGGSTIDEGHSTGRRLLAGGTPITAIIAQSDLLAAGVVRAAEAAGLRVPDDLSVTGFDGIRVDGFEGHRITTIAQHPVEQGHRAADALLAALDGASLPHVAMPVDLVVGDTTGPAPQAGPRTSSSARPSNSA